MKRSVTALVMLVLAGCDASEGDPSGSGGSAGAMQTTGGTSGASGSGSGGASGASGAGAGGAGGAGAGGMMDDELFTDSTVPDCTTGPWWKLTGTIGSEQIMLDGSADISSNIEPGKLYVLGLEPGGGITVGDTYHPLILNWEGSVMERGTSRALTGTRFLIPGGDPAMPSGYCIKSGDIGPTTDMPSVLFKFRVTAVQRYENGACTGAEQPASLAGCMIRNNDYLP